MAVKCSQFSNWIQMRSDIYQRTEWITWHCVLRHWDLIPTHLLTRFTLGKWVHCYEPWLLTSEVWELNDAMLLEVLTWYGTFSLEPKALGLTWWRARGNSSYFRLYLVTHSVQVLPQESLGLHWVEFSVLVWFRTIKTQVPH